jgi:hypothetical protein
VAPGNFFPGETGIDSIMDNGVHIVLMDSHLQLSTRCFTQTGYTILILNQKRGTKEKHMTKHKGSLINIFSENMFLFTGNPYVAFMFQQIDFELQKLINNKKDSDDSDAYFDSFDLKKVVSVLLLSNPKDSKFREHVNRIFKNLPVKDNFNLKDSDYEKSWMLKRIKTLKIDFAQKLNGISETEKIPLSSIVRIYHYFLYYDYFIIKPTGKESPAPSNIGIKDMFDRFLKAKSHESRKKYLSELASIGQLSENKNDPPDEFRLINIPKNLSEEAQEESVITAWKKIRNLFIENLYVFVFVGALETLILTATYKSEGIEKIKEKLLLTAFNADMEKKIKAISSKAKLKSFFKDNLYCFSECLIDFIKSYGKFSENKANTREIIELMESLDLYEKGDLIEVETALKNKEKILFEYLHIELSPQLLDFCEKKSGALQKYELTGKPDKLRGYIYRILANFIKTLSKFSFNKFLVKEFGISVSTFKRYNKKYQNGHYDHLFNNFGQKPESLYEIVNDDKYKVFFDMINFEEEKRKVHFKDGFLTQKDLILEIFGERTVSFKEIEFKSTEEGDHDVFMLIEDIKKANLFENNKINDHIDYKSLNNISDVDNSFSDIDDDGNSFSDIDDDGNSSSNSDDPIDKSNTRSAQIDKCIDLLNNLLDMPNLYDEFGKKMPKMKLSQFLTDLVEITKPLRQKKNYNDLLENEQYYYHLSIDG